MAAPPYLPSTGGGKALDPDGSASSRTDLIQKGRHYAAKPSRPATATAPHHPMARLVAVDETERRARGGQARGEWTVAAYIGPQHTGNARREVRISRQGSRRLLLGRRDDPRHAERVADQIRSFAGEIGMTYRCGTDERPVVPGCLRQGVRASPADADPKAGRESGARTGSLWRVGEAERHSDLTGTRSCSAELQPSWRLGVELNQASARNEPAKSESAQRQ